MPRKRSDPDLLRVSPLVKEFFVIANDKGITFDNIARQAGVSRETIMKWRNATSPNLTTFVAALNSLGYDLDVKKLGD
jgi:DNA-binding phage protein